MKIGFDAKRYYHNSTGLGNYARNLIEGLKLHAPQIDSCLYDCKGLERSFAMAKHAAQENCGIFHGLSNSLPFDVGSRTVKASGMKSIVTVHDLCWKTFPQMYHAPDILIHDLKCRFAVKHADCIIAISESTKNDIIKYYGTDPEKIKLIYQSVDGSYFQTMDKRQAWINLSDRFPRLAKDFILCVGSINPRKNQLNALKALSAIAPGNRPQLVICGKGDRDYIAQCQDYACRCLHPTDVLWLDNADNQTLRLLYSAALAMLYPSFYEGFGLPVVEALLQSTPVITSKLSSLPEAAGPGAVLVDPSDVSEISNGIIKLCESYELRTTLASAGRDYCLSTFSTEKAISEYVKIYRDTAINKA